MTGWSRWMIRRGVVTPAFRILCLYLIRGRKNKKCLKKTSDTLKHETEITIGDWDTDRVSVAQEWQFGKFELFIGCLKSEGDKLENNLLCTHLFCHTLKGKDNFSAKLFCHTLRGTVNSYHKQLTSCELHFWNPVWFRVKKFRRCLMIA